MLHANFTVLFHFNQASVFHQLTCGLSNLTSATQYHQNLLTEEGNQFTICFFLLKSDVNVLLSSSLLLYLCVMKTINPRENIRLSRTKFHCLKLSGNLYLSGKLEILSLF